MSNATGTMDAKAVQAHLSKMGVNAPRKAIDKLIKQHGSAGKLPASALGAVIAELTRIKTGVRPEAVHHAPSPAAGGPRARPKPLDLDLETKGAEGMLPIERAIAAKLRTKFTKVQSAFLLFDRDRSGKVTGPEFRQALHNLGFDLTDDEYVTLMRKYDRDGSGEVSYQELNAIAQGAIHGGSDGGFEIPTVKGASVNAPLKIGTVTPMDRDIAQRMYSKFGHMRKVFLNFDSDHSGSITRAEFRMALEHLSFYLNDDQFAQIVAKYDPENRGHISYEYFNRVVHAILKVPAEAGADAEVLKAGFIPEWKGAQAPTGKILPIEITIAQRLFSRFNQVHKVFLMFDQDRSGGVNAEEFRKGLSMLSIELTDDEHRALVAKYDRDRNGIISYAEFNSAIGSIIHGGMGPAKVQDLGHVHNVQALERPPPDRFVAESLFTKYRQLAHAFHTVDVGRSGSVTYLQFRNVLQTLGYKMSTAEFDALLRMYDPHNTGLVPYNLVMKRVIEPLSAAPDAPVSGTSHLLQRPMSHAVTDSTGMAGSVDRTALWAEKQIFQATSSKYTLAEKTFKALDVDRDGYLTRSELMHALEKMGCPVTRSELNQLFEKLSGTEVGVSLAAFMGHLRSLLPALTEAPARPLTSQAAPDILKGRIAARLFGRYHEVQTGFRMLDLENSGTLSYGDFRRVLHNFGIILQDAEFRDFAEIYDPTHTGRISYTDFNSQVCNLLQPMKTEVVVVNALGQDGPIQRRHTRAYVDAFRIERMFAQRAIAPVQTISQTLAKFDVEGKNRIACKKFLQVISDAGISLSIDERRQLLDRFDPKRTGQVNIGEFNQYLTRLIKHPSKLTSSVSMVDFSNTMERTQQMRPGSSATLLSQSQTLPPTSPIRGGGDLSRSTSQLPALNTSTRS